MSTKKRNIVCYTGKGAKQSGIHSEAEFMKAVRPLCTLSGCPKKADIAAWIEWAGALLRTPSQCKRVIALNRKIQAAIEANKDAANRFDKCASSSRCTRLEDRQAFSRCVITECAKPVSTLVKREASLKKAIAASDKAVAQKSVKNTKMS